MLECNFQRGAIKPPTVGHVWGQTAGRSVKDGVNGVPVPRGALYL